MKTSFRLFGRLLCSALLAGSPAFAADQFTPVAAQNVSAANNVFLNLQNQAVADTGGQQAGTMDYVLISPGGCIDVALISIGQQRVVAVPWQLVTVQSSAQAGSTQGGLTPTGRTAPPPFQVRVEAARLRQAPSFSVNQLHMLNQQNALQQVYQYFGVQPSQNNQSTGQPQQNDGTTPPTPPPQNQNQQNDPNQNQNLPPGLQRRDTLPPGLDRRESLPPGLQRGATNPPPAGQPGTRPNPTPPQPPTR